MTGVSWLDAVATLIEERSAGIDISRPDDATLAITVGPRGAVLHAVGEDAFLMTSLAPGNTIASRVQERVVHSDAERFAIEPATVRRAFETVLNYITLK